MVDSGRMLSVAGIYYLTPDGHHLLIIMILIQHRSIEEGHVFSKNSVQ